MHCNKHMGHFDAMTKAIAYYILLEANLVPMAGAGYRRAWEKREGPLAGRVGGGPQAQGGLGTRGPPTEGKGVGGPQRGLRSSGRQGAASRGSS